ncbi:hypothetical protein ACFL6T_00235 [Candidatus Zixiibacteriota bacterium]
MMKSSLRYYPALVLLAVATLTSACAGGMAGSKARMYDWDAGTKVVYELTTVQTTTLEIPGAGEQAMGSLSSVTFEVVSTGPRKFDVTFIDASESADQADMTGLVPEINELIGTTGSVTLDALGKIVESSGLEENPYVEFLGSEAFLDQTLQVLFQILPEGGLVEGSEWGREYAYPFGIMGLEMEMAFSEAYNCLEAGTYENEAAFRIGNSGTSSLIGGGEIQGAIMDMMLSGTGEGYSWISATTGMLLQSENTIRMGGGISAQGMDIPMNMELKVTLVVTDRGE